MIKYISKCAEAYALPNYKAATLADVPIKESSVTDLVGFRYIQEREV